MTCQYAESVMDSGKTDPLLSPSVTLDVGEKVP